MNRGQRLQMNAVMAVLLGFNCTIKVAAKPAPPKTEQAVATATTNKSGSLESDLTWDETGVGPRSRVAPVIPAFGGATVHYQRNGKAVVQVRLTEPVVIAVADKPEKWGRFQFPSIYRSFDGRLVAKWHMAADSIASYGKGGVDFRISSDNGKTWIASDKPAPAGEGLALPGGDRLTIKTPAALKVDELKLPKPFATNSGPDWRTFVYYRVSELPDALQGVYLTRTSSSGAASDTHASLYDPGAVRYARNGLLPVVFWGDMKLLPDKSIVAGIYPAFYENPTGGVNPSGESFYRSTDMGHSWRIVGKLPQTYDPGVDPTVTKRKIYWGSEPAFEILPDGTFLSVIRTSDGFGNDSPMYVSRSSDQGVTWSQPRAFAPNGVMPRLLQLQNGVLVLSSGRPGVQLRFSFDGKGEQWTDPFDMLPFTGPDDAVSCGYARPLATGSDRFLIVYSDFKYPNQKSDLRKAIKVREIIVSRQDAQ